MYEAGEVFYRKHGSEVYSVPKSWELLAQSNDPVTRLGAHWKKLHKDDYIPPEVIQAFTQVA